jgi:hypothetical protein
MELGRTSENSGYSLRNQWSYKVMVSPGDGSRNNFRNLPINQRRRQKIPNMCVASITHIYHELQTCLRTSCFWSYLILRKLLTGCISNLDAKLCFILKLVSEEKGMRMWTELNYLRMRARVDFCEPSTEKNLYRGRATVRLEVGLFSIALPVIWFCYGVSCFVYFRELEQNKIQ